MPHDDARCAVCSVTVVAMGARACPTCGVLYHRDCWDWVGACSIFGCEGGAPVRRPVALRPGYWAAQPPPAFSLRRFFAHNAIVMLLPVLLGGAAYYSTSCYRPCRLPEEYVIGFFGLSVLYCLVGPLFDARHPFTYAQRRAENGLLKTRIFASGLLAFYDPVLWGGLVAAQIVMALVTPGLPRRATAA